MQRHGGVSRYFVELIKAMMAMGGFEPIVPRFFTDNQYLQCKRIFFTERHFKGKVRLMQTLNRGISLRSLRSGFDLFHPTYFQPYFLARLRVPFVITVHDMTHHLFGHPYVRDDGTRTNMRVLCQRASRIIAVSQATKKDLCALIDIPEAKVAVIHHGTSLSYDGGPRPCSRRYVLFVCERRGYKNFNFFLSAVSKTLLDEDIDLVCVGSRHFDQDERRSFEGLGAGSHVRHIDVSTSGELARLYHFAAAFCYPSLHEGFGIPLLEAFSCGCPVVASAIPSFREVAGEAAEYFDPEEASTIRASLERVLSSSERALDLVQKGHERVQLFSWEKAARSTLEVYRAAI
jgi:glycosyltransferase involved in cell wall biosynthesis